MFAQATLRCSQRTNCLARGGGGSMNRQPFHDLLRDLPPELQRAVHHCVAQCRPHIAPRPYTSDWHEELYHEAAYAACRAETTYDPDRGGSLYHTNRRAKVY